MHPTRIVSIAVLALCTGLACTNEYDHVELAGRDGVLRFNLVFDNEDEVDLDLRVTTPNGVEIAWDSVEGDGGQLDVDCYCNLDGFDSGGSDNCEQGPNENIYWDYGGEAPLGRYDIEVDYYGSCDFVADPPPSSSYTLRVLQSGAVVAEHTGTLSADSDFYTHEQALGG